MQLVFNIKANLKRPLSLQFVCNQGNHSVVKTTNLFLQCDYSSPTQGLVKLSYHILHVQGEQVA